MSKRKNCLNSLREGDSLVIWRLDRLGRTMAEKHQVEALGCAH
ncbi:recombinase family protein [Noviherbaspirillum soli]